MGIFFLVAKVSGWFLVALLHVCDRELSSCVLQGRLKLDAGERVSHDRKKVKSPW